MKIIGYASKEDNVFSNLQRVMEDLVPKEDVRICDTLEKLTGRICRPGGKKNITVLAAINQSELTRILSLYDILSDLKTILILPDRKPETISKAHRIAPRFLSYISHDFRDVKLVLSKMLKL